jgi:hypothetical protein
MVEAIKAAFPDETEESLADSIEGQTQLDGAIIAVLRNAIEREAMGKALGELIDGMTARRRRLDEGARSLRAAALQAIQESGLSLPLRAPDMSVGIGRAKPKVIITDPALVPLELCKTTVEPSKTLIAEAWAQGRDVPGVTLGNAVNFLTIRRS